MQSLVLAAAGVGLFAIPMIGRWGDWELFRMMLFGILFYVPFSPLGSRIRAWAVRNERRK